MRTHPVAGFLFVCLVVSTSWAQPLGTAFTYQGRLKSGGSPAGGSHDLQFTLYGVPAGGSIVAGPICADNVNIADGLFTVPLDFGAVFGGNKRWLEIGVRADSTPGNCGTGAYTPLSPRQELTAAPNALFASNADQLDGLDSTAFLTGVPNPLSLTGTSDLFIIAGHNLSAVNGASGVFGLASAASGQIYGVQGNSASTNGFGVFGVATSTTGSSRGGFFESASSQGIGVLGLAKATTGGAFGVYGQSDSSSGSGVYALATAATGTTYGMWSQSVSTSGRGVYGLATAATGNNFGVYGQSNSMDGIGIYGLTTAATGINFGVYGRSDSTSGSGVYGLATDATGSTYGVWGQSNGTHGYGVYGLATDATGSNFGMWGESYSTEGCGVIGRASAPTGLTYGVLGTSASPNGFGVFGSGITGVRGESTSTTGRGVYGSVQSATGFTYGMWGQSWSTDGIGVYGLALSATGTTYGMWGQSNSTSGRGVYGLASATTGRTFGGSFETQSSGTDATGVFGLASDFGGGTTYGVWGQSNSTSGYGVIGINARTSGITYGVWGRSASTSGYGVYANGNMGASGVKSFRIDHPDDPENKYLLHYSVESPEVLNAYSGKATLDGAGQAVVELPRYFAKINKDPRYTLTAVGAPMPNLHVADEIDEAALSAGAKAEPREAAPKCSFRIAGGAAGKKVSWEVKAVRNDKWVQNRAMPVAAMRDGVAVQTRAMPVEVEKESLERGTYQHPEFYGQPKEKGMNYRAEQERPSPPAIPNAAAATRARAAVAADSKP